MVVDALDRALTAARAGGHGLYLIVDGAQSEGSNEHLARMGMPCLSLFDGTPEASVPEIAPLLIPLNDIAASRRRELFDWAQALAFSTPAISWITSRFDPHTLADHLRRFHVVGLSEGQALLLRWYDTRILPIWLDCLTPDQHAAFTAGAFAWEAVDRTGAVVTLLQQPVPPASPDKPRFGARQITLDDAQYSLLVDASALDGLLRQLRRVIPDELKRVDRNELARFVERCLAVALAAGLGDLDRQTQVALLGLYTSGQGFAQEEFRQFLLAPPAPLEDFYEGMQALSDDVWDVGPPLWETNQAATPARPS